MPAMRHLLFIVSLLATPAFAQQAAPGEEAPAPTASAPADKAPAPTAPVPADKAPARETASHETGEPYYITDSFQVTIRRGTDISFKIIKMLRTGDIIRVLEKLPSGWSRVRTSDGQEGFIQTLYLADKPPALTRLEPTEKALAAMTAERDRLQGEVAALKARLAELADLQKEMEELRKISTEGVSLNQANQTLTEQMRSLRAELAETKEQKQELKKQSDYKFFLTGAAVLGLGLLGGLMLGRAGGRRNGYAKIEI